MTKPLSQITFEFSGTEETETPANVSVGVVRVKPKENKTVEAPVAVKKTSTRGRRSLKDIGLAAELVQIPDDEILFQKQYYSIGEVATMFRENQSLIRYWEIEFDILQPRKNRKGDRFFRPIDVKNLVLIYDLLRRRKFTIEGAKDYLKKNKKAEEKFAMIQSMEKIKSFLLELKATL
jgi:DNA-binding transcriptional MerR regulator